MGRSPSCPPARLRITPTSVRAGIAQGQNLSLHVEQGDLLSLYFDAFDGLLGQLINRSDSDELAHQSSPLACGQGGIAASAFSSQNHMPISVGTGRTP